MGIFLNSAAPYSLYESEVKKPYFVDKSLMLEELFLPAETGNSHICITRPRRFGKTVMANMVSAFFSRGVDSTEIFSKLKIAGNTGYKKHLNTHPPLEYQPLEMSPLNPVSIFAQSAQYIYHTNCNFLPSD